MRNFAFVFTLIPVWLVYFLLDEKGYRLLSFVVPTLMAVKIGRASCRERVSSKV